MMGFLSNEQRHKYRGRAERTPAVEILRMSKENIVMFHIFDKIFYRILHTKEDIKWSF